MLYVQWYGIITFDYRIATPLCDTHSYYVIRHLPYCILLVHDVLSLMVLQFYGVESYWYFMHPYLYFMLLC